MNRSEYVFKGSKGPFLGVLLVIGAIAAVLIYMLLLLLTKLQPFSKGFTEISVILGVFVIGPILAVILKLKRGRKWGAVSALFVAYFITIPIVLVLSIQILPAVTKNLPLRQEVLNIGKFILVALYLVFAAVMVIMKTVTRCSITISKDGGLSYCVMGRPRNYVNIREYRNRVETGAYIIYFKKGDAANTVDNCIYTGDFSYLKRRKIEKLIIEHAGSYVDNVEQLIEKKELLPQGWESRIKTDVLFRDEIFDTISGIYRWEKYDYLRGVLTELGHNGHIKSMTTLASCGLIPQEEKLLWLRSAANSGDAESALTLGDYYFDHQWSDYYNPFSAESYYEIAAKDSGEIGNKAKVKLESAKNAVSRARNAKARENAASPTDGVSFESGNKNADDPIFLRNSSNTLSQYRLGSNIDGTTKYVYDEDGNKRVVHRGDYDDWVDGEGNHYK